MCINNYNYTNKSLLASSLDTLSYPTRIILGGKNVCISNKHCFAAWSTTSKIIAVVCFAYFYKIALFTIVCLTLKTVYFHLWEKSIVHKEVQQTFQATNTFNQLFQLNKHEKAFLVYQREPAIAWAPNVQSNYLHTVGVLYQQYLQAIQTKHATWAQITSSTEVQRFMHTLPTQETCWLIDRAVLQGLYKLEEQEEFTTIATSKEYFKTLKIFIQKSLRSNKDEITACYKMLGDQTFQSLTTDSDAMQSSKSVLKIYCNAMHYAFSKYDTTTLRQRGFYLDMKKS